MAYPHNTGDVLWEMRIDQQFKLFAWWNRVASVAETEFGNKKRVLFLLLRLQMSQQFLNLWFSRAASLREKKIQVHPCTFSLSSSTGWCDVYLCKTLIHQKFNISFSNLCIAAHRQSLIVPCSSILFFFLCSVRFYCVLLCSVHIIRSDRNVFQKVLRLISVFKQIGFHSISQIFNRNAVAFCGTKWFAFAPLQFNRDGEKKREKLKIYLYISFIYTYIYLSILCWGIKLEIVWLS